MVKKYSQKRILRNKKSKSKKQKGGRKTRVRRRYSKNKQKGGAFKWLDPKYIIAVEDFLLKLRVTSTNKLVIFDSNGDKYYFFSLIQISKYDMGRFQQSGACNF